MIHKYLHPLIAAIFYNLLLSFHSVVSENYFLHYNPQGETMPFDHFDFLAPFYDNVIRFDRLEKLLEMTALPTSGMLLDAGGGTGRIAQALKPFIDQIIIADLSRGMLLQAAGKGLTGACAHIEYLPFPSNYFERVIMVDALHHVCNQSETARELWRVLKPGGRLVVEEPNIRKFAVKLVALAEKLTLMRSQFLSGTRIANLFAFTSNQIEVYAQDHTVWVVLEKD
jgi:demethylmenaquinone methyltransferase/2-methoxy-6-polyprenyl-1,4-benzoquinol methylase